MLRAGILRVVLAAAAVLVTSLAVSVSPASALIATTTTVAVAPHPTLAGYWTATPTITYAGGQITKGECTTYLDGVRVGLTLNCSGESFPTPSPGAHTVRVEYVPDPYGIPSDRETYASSEGSTSFIVAAPPVTTTPPAPTPASPVTSVAKVSTAKKSVAKKRRTFTVTVTATDGTPLSGTVFLVIAGPQKITQKLSVNAGHMVTSLVLKKTGNYTATVKVSKTTTFDSSTSPAVRFKVVAPKR
ncbi:hypothetical protein [Nocardioides hwasunensis]|uniref:Bacterial Ig-like domain-containing protein n=1 Tax=Nocardioides hwasunensis TaxID=397258 RepID=A0ABR8MIY7_9ACTN|nr:hypothetical protein [Nocardioides hwasunensis]MBD3916010.1 hypothetical protein [Nocardioides hwasunensis]